MDIGFKKKNNRKLTSGDVGEMLGSFWSGHYKLFFFVTLLVVLGIGGYFWYESLYQSAWSDQERMEYKNAKDSGINFKEKDFSSALKVIEERKARYVQAQESLRDVFRKY